VDIVVIYPADSGGSDSSPAPGPLALPSF
jgi:hypothetical protein